MLEARWPEVTQTSGLGLDLTAGGRRVARQHRALRRIEQGCAEMGGMYSISDVRRQTKVCDGTGIYVSLPDSLSLGGRDSIRFVPGIGSLEI